MTDTADRVLVHAMEVGRRMLAAGAEIHRVEDTVERLCLVCGACKASVFALNALLIAEARMPDGSHSTQMCRVGENKTDLGALEDLNSFSRRVCSAQEPLRVLEETPLPEKKKSAVALSFLGAALAAGGFALLFGGTWKDAVGAVAVGLVVRLMEFVRPLNRNQMVHAACSAFLAGVLALLLAHFSLCDSSDKVMIGTVMLLIPGLALGTSLRDMLTGEIISGSMRLVQSLLLAVMLALGFFAAMLLMGAIL